jgi:Protein-tyrosine phosphatase
MSIHNEFKEIPQISVRVEEVPENCEDKNRYANVVPLPETRVHLQRFNDDEKTEYINANYVKVMRYLSRVLIRYVSISLFLISLRVRKTTPIIILQRRHRLKILLQISGA